jgi:hypothetical protein
MMSRIAHNQLRETVWSRGARFVLAVCYVAMTCTFVSCSGDLQESFHSSLANARRDGLIDRGWIPDILPESSQNIRELHDVSGGTTWCTFDFAPADWASFRQNLERGAVESPNRVQRPQVSWWPPLLTGELDFDRIRRAGLELHALARPGNPEVILFVIDSPKGRGFFYRIPRYPARI